MTSKKSEVETKKYEVTRKHCLDYKVGQIVSLTDDKARKLSGKVELYEPKLEQADQDEELKEFIAGAEKAVKDAIDRADEAEANLALETTRADEAEAEVAALKAAAETPLNETKADTKKGK